VIKQRLMGLRLSPALLGTIVFLVALETVTDRLPKTPIIGLSSEISTLGRGLAIALVLLGWLYLVSHILPLGAYFNNRRRLSGRKSAAGHRPVSP